MAKTKLSEYDSTAGNNTDVANINIAEGCAPSNLNNAIRAVMGHLRDFISGTSGDALSPAAGGTGATTLAANSVILGNGTLAVTTVAPGTTGNVLVSDGSTWTSGVGVPSGSLFMWPNSSAPTGYLACDGSAVSRSTYAALFAVVGTAFGSGDGSTTFNLPDYRDRMPIGAGTTYSAASTGGSKDAIVVSHTHTGTTAGAGSHNHTGSSGARLFVARSGEASGVQGGSAFYDTGIARDPTTSTAANHTHTITTNSTGSSGTDANLPPYLGIHFIIKT